MAAMGLVGVSLLVRWVLGWLLCLHIRRLPQEPLAGAPRVSVLIPARNEESTLPHLLSALRRQRPVGRCPPMELGPQGKCRGAGRRPRGGGGGGRGGARAGPRSGLLRLPGRGEELGVLAR